MPQDKTISASQLVQTSGMHIEDSRRLMLGVRRAALEAGEERLVQSEIRISRSLTVLAETAHRLPARI